MNYEYERLKRLFLEPDPIDFEPTYTIDKCIIIKHIHCDPKAKVTVVIFEDNSKEICRCTKDDVYNEYAGICICIAKHLYGKSKLEKFIDTKKTVVYNKTTNQKKGAK